MDTLPSAKFRRQYAFLERETHVTVNGHVIGRWTPMAAESSPEAEAVLRHLDSVAESRRVEFRPAPKPQPRRK